MDKNKIIDDILNEWAMRSHDGLVSGHSTPENQLVLQEILAEKKTTSPKEKEMAKKMMKPVAMGATKQTKIKNTSKFKTDLERYKHFASEKRAGNTSAKWMRNAINTSTSDEAAREFLDMYDVCSMEEAIEVYNNPRYASIIDRVEGKERKGLGRGELIFVFLMEGYKSGGTREVDLVFGSIDRDIEMKELTGKNKKPVINISAPTLKGYYNTEFRLAIDELATEIRKSGNKNSEQYNYDFNKDKNLGNFLVHVFRNYSGDVPGNKIKMERSLENFVRLLRTTEMPTNLFNAFTAIWQKLQSKEGSVSVAAGGNDSAANVPTGTAKIGITVGGEKKEFSVDPVQAKKELQSLTTDPKKNSIQLNVTSDKQEMTETDYIGETKNLLYFKNKYTISKISVELRSLLKNKYSGLIVIDKRSGNNAKFVSSNSNFTFLSLGFNKINFILPDEEKNVKADDDGGEN
jgi:hypothetical protein